jgi:glycosyltransferase involved in cell wall biosynthesis
MEDLNQFEKPSEKLLIVCPYYKPYISGLSNVAANLAEKLSKLGLDVTVLCHQHDETLDLFEVLNGVKVYRAKRLFKFNRATISLDFFVKYFKLAKNQDYVNLHLPLPEAGFLVTKKGQKLVITYHCDLPRNSFAMKVISFLMDQSSKVAIKRSQKVIFSTLDYMNESRMHSYSENKTIEIFPFVNVSVNAPALFAKGTGRNFGYLGRFTSEKGAILLIEAFCAAALNEDRLLLAGSSKVAGDSIYEKVKAAAAKDSRIILLPDISEEDLSGFYSSLTAFCFPSLNSFEAFGIAQVEAIVAGVPVLSSNLPGVRVPVMLTGMGQLLPVGDQIAWQKAIKQFDRSLYAREISEKDRQLFSHDEMIRRYLDVLQK